MLAGRIPDALAACRLLLGRHHDPDIDGPVRISLGHALLAQGQVRDALQELERAGQTPALSIAERGAAQAWAGFTRMSLGDLDGAAALAGQARSAAASADDHQTTSIAMSTAARISESRGHLREALEIAEEAVRLADESPGRMGHRFPVCVTSGRVLTDLDRLPDAKSALGTGMLICEEMGVRWALSFHQVYLAYGCFLAGEWDDAIAELEASLKLAEEIGEIYSFVYAYGLLSRISVHRNDLGRAREAAAAADRNLVGWGSGQSMTWVAWPRALILEAGGEPGRALATMAGLWDWCVGAGLALEYPAIGADLVRLALAAGDLGRARQASAAVAGAPAAGRSSAGTVSPRPSTPSRTWSPRGCPIPRSARACISHTGPSRHTSRTSSPSWTFPHARSLPPRSPGGGATRWADDALPAATAAYTRLSSRTLVTWPVPHTLAISRSTTSVTDRALAIAAPGDRPASPARPASGRAAAVPANAKPTVMPTTNGPAWKRTAT